MQLTDTEKERYWLKVEDEVEFDIKTFYGRQDMKCEMCEERSRLIGTSDSREPKFCYKHYEEINKDAEFFRLTLTKEVKEEFIELVAKLSPENLSCDGEITPAEAQAKYRTLTVRWKRLEHSLGMKVTEREAWAWAEEARNIDTVQEELIEMIKDYISTQVIPVDTSQEFDKVMQYEAETLTGIIRNKFIVEAKV